MPTRKVVPLRDYTEFHELEGGWRAYFHLLEITGDGATQDDAWQAMVNALGPKLESDEQAREVWQAWATEHAIDEEIPADELKAKEDLVAESHAASEGFEQLTDAGFDEAVAAGSVLVDFWAEWCMPCHMISPILKQVGERLDGRLRIAKVNVDENSEVPSRFGVQGIPCMVLLVDGVERHRVVGAGRSVDQMLGELEPHLP